MSILGLGKGNRSDGGNRSRRVEPRPPGAPRPKVAEKRDPQAQQYQLGTTTLEAVDQLTGMTADEIEIVADRLATGARETEELLRELAHRVREYGVIANERLANFVKAANGCADMARTMIVRLDHRDTEAAVDSAAEAEAPAPETEDEVYRPVDLDALDAEIEDVPDERAPPTQPGD